MGVGLEPTTGSERADLQSAAVATVPSHNKLSNLVVKEHISNQLNTNHIISKPRLFVNNYFQFFSN